MKIDQPELTPVTEPVPDATKGAGWNLRLVGRLIIMILTAEVALMAFTYPTNALVQIGTEFQTNQVAWLQTAYALSASVSAMLIGNLADRHGKRRVILAVLVIALAGLVLSALAPSFGIMVAGRVLQSTTLALPFLLPSLVRDIYPVRTIPTAIALVSTGAGALSIFVSLSAGFVITHLGYRAVFWVPAALVAAMLVLVALLIPESEVRSIGSRFDIAGATLFGLGLAGVLLGISLAPVSGWSSTTTMLLLGAGAVFLATWVAQSFKVRHPMIDLREFKHFPFLVTFLFALLGTSASIWFFVINTTVALTPNTQGWGLGMTPEQASIFAALFTLGSFLGGLAVGPILSRIPAPTVAAVSPVFLVIGFGIAAVGLSNPVLFGLAAVLVGLSSGANFAVMFNLLVLVVDAQKQATMAALVTVGSNVGGAILPVAIFAYLNSAATFTEGMPLYTFTGMQVAMIIPAALGVVLIGFAIALKRSQHSKTELLAGTRK